MSGTKRIEICAVGDVEEGGILKVEKDELTVAVYRVEGNYYVTDDQCTHGPGSLSEGFLDGFEIECDFHQGCFDIRTGEVTEPPCLVPIKTYSVTVESDRVFIDI